jgi:hypothetical protein
VRGKSEVANPENDAAQFAGDSAGVAGGMVAEAGTTFFNEPDSSHSFQCSCRMRLTSSVARG